MTSCLRFFYSDWPLNHNGGGNVKLVYWYRVINQNFYSRIFHFYLYTADRVVVTATLHNIVSVAGTITLDREWGYYQSANLGWVRFASSMMKVRNQPKLRWVGGTTKLRNKNETKRNETKRSEKWRNETKRNEVSQNETQYIKQSIKDPKTINEGVKINEILSG